MVLIKGFSCFVNMNRLPLLDIQKMAGEVLLPLEKGLALQPVPQVRSSKSLIIHKALKLCSLLKRETVIFLYILH